MKKFSFLFICFYFVVGCVSRHSSKKEDFKFSSISSSGTLKYDSKSDVFSDNRSGKNRNVKLQLTQTEKDSLFKFYPKNFNKCLVFSDEINGKSFQRIQLTYMNQKEISVCDTLDFEKNETSKSELEFYGILKGFLSKKPDYRYTFPEEFTEL